MIGEKLVDIMLKDGVKIDSHEKDRVARDLRLATKEGRLYFIERDNMTIGFASYIEKKDKIHLNYCFIYKDCREPGTLLGLRKFFRSIGDTFTWKSRKRHRFVKVK